MKRGLLSVLLLSCVACATATGEVSGGEPRFDSGSNAFADADPQSWTGLYRDLFGANGRGSCSSTNSCHGSAAQPGSVMSGFVCGDKAGCLESLKSPDSGLIKASDAMMPEGAGFYGVLRKRSNGAVIGIMPKSPMYVFTDDELARVKAWIAKGSPND